MNSKENTLWEESVLSYFGDASWSVSRLGVEKNMGDFSSEPPFDGAIVSIGSGQEIETCFENTDWKDFLKNSMKYARVLFLLENLSADDLTKLSYILENTGFNIIGYSDRETLGFLCAEYYGGHNAECRKDFSLGYYKMSRYKVYQQMQQEILGCRIAGKVVEIGDTNTVFRDMLDSRKISNMRAPYPEYDLQNMHQFQEGSLDAFICDNTLEHVPYPIKAVSEMHRVLKPGGTAIIMMPFIAICQASDYCRFSLHSMKYLFAEFKEIKTGFWGNQKAAASYIERDKWVSVDKEFGGNLYCHDRQNLSDGTIILSSAQDARYPIHIWAILTK